MSKRIFIFIGPTISEAECRTHLDATYLPPVSQGDVASLLRFHPDAIGIVDGYFDQVPSVWHKEILLALSKGVRVVGAASMGALRAAELHPFGMEGVGKIFEWYRDGVIDADDEVALRHAPAELDYVPLSDALVNIRATLEAACNDGAASPSTCETLIRLARAMPYWKRTFKSVLEAGLQSGLGGEALLTLKTYVERKRVDQKKEDALALLGHIAALDGNRPAADVHVEATGYFKGLLDSDVRLGLPGDLTQPTLGELTDFARLQLPDFKAVMEQAGDKQTRRMLAGRLGVRVSTREMDEEEASFRARHGIESEEALQAWLDRNGAGREELREHLEELALERKIRHMFSVSNNRHTLWELREAGRFEPLLAAWRERNATPARASSRTVTQDELFAMYKSLTGDSHSATFIEAALRLGFHSKTNLLAELLRIHRHRSNVEGE